MTTFRLANDLAAVLLPIGVIGAALAVVCAVVAGIAIMRGAGGLSGGAVGVWIVFALMSFTASFANEWLPLLVAGGALAAMLMLGGVVRAIVNATASGRHTRPSAVVTSAPVRAPARAPATGAVAVVTAS